MAFSESAARIGRYASDNDLRWVFAEAPALARAYNVRSQSSWTAIAPDGVIVRSRGYGRDRDGYWRGVLDQLRGG